jgi:hypothetical protein
VECQGRRQSDLTPQCAQIQHTKDYVLCFPHEPARSGSCGAVPRALDLRTASVKKCKIRTVVAIALNGGRGERKQAETGKIRLQASSSGELGRMEAQKLRQSVGNLRVIVVVESGQER